jgi:hypothetical protein
MKTPTLLKFFKTWNETIGFILSFFLFLFSPLFIRLFDSQAGSFDFGTIQVVIISTMIFQWSGVVAWFTFRFNFPSLHKYLDDQMEDEIIEPKAYEQKKACLGTAWFALTVYMFYFALMVLINAAFISMDVTW